ncbi:MAG: o-succinylbenzoate synthase [Leptolyngbya sp. SIO4C1]|nr:o-succinylbenzoate synthase [Leptolyngbya sp. SIO4C1]
MVYRFEFRPYRRPFRRALATRYGLWQVREGIILKLTSEQGRCGYGEIAPLPWFGSETLDQALQFCAQLPTQLSEATLFSILPTLPACQFGFETLFSNLARSLHHAELSPAHYSALLPTGEAAHTSWLALWEMGYRTFKWKIGVAAVSDEMRQAEKLFYELPPGASLRLDANGNLDELTARYWLDWCDSTLDSPNAARLEFIEQPLPPKQFATMLKLSQRYRTSLALDESVATLEQLKAHYYQGWEGVYVIKAAIAGAPSRLKKFCLAHPIDCVLSSVFETAIGRQAVIDLALQLAAIAPYYPQRALGFGTQQWFPLDQFRQMDWHKLWQQL